MRGEEQKQKSMLVLMNPEELIPRDHPLRSVRKLAEAAFQKLSPVFDQMYSRVGRPSIPPERLLLSTILMALYSIRSERMFCEQLRYNFLFRWFLGMDMIEPAFDHSVFSANRERLMDHEVSGLFFREIVAQAREKKLMSDEHFTVDGSLIEAWASLKSFKRKAQKDDGATDSDDPGNPSVDFHGEKRSNDTHQSTTDAEAKLMRKGKGKEAKLSYSLHSLMENRNGLLVDFKVGFADGFSERFAAIEMVDDSVGGAHRITIGADKGYDSEDFVEALRERNAAPHLAQNDSGKRGSAIDRRTTRHPGYKISRKKRKRVEKIFGWVKTIALFGRTRYKGRLRTQFWAYLMGAAYNLLRMSRPLMNTA